MPSRPLHLALCLLVSGLLLVLAGCAEMARRGSADPPVPGVTGAGTEALLAQAEEAYSAGQWSVAEEHYLLLTARHEVAAEAWFRLGNIYARTGRAALASKAYEEVVARDPAHARAWHNLGVVQVRSAIATFTAMGTAADPADPLVQRGHRLAAALDALLAEESPAVPLPSSPAP